MEAEDPAHTAVLLPAFAAGSAFTVTVTELDLEQPVAVTVSVTVYVVVAEGLTDALDAVEVNPDGELDQE